VLEAYRRLSGDARPAVLPASLVSDSDRDVAAALEKVEPAQRDVLLLHAWGDLSYEEIADALDIPLGTVRSRLSRARASLQTELTQLPRTEVEAL
jgi:DNA-directed RNA polymerase specialized sigma24 family protein